MYGTITRVMIDKGFGFIRERGSVEKKETFFHFTQLGGGLTFDEQLVERVVQYDVQNTPKGARAENIRPG